MKFTPYNDAEKVVKELLESLRSKYQDNLETSMRESDFIFDLVQLMYYKFHKVNFKRGGSYIDFSDWIKNKIAIIIPKNEDDKFFQYAGTVALNYEKIELHPKRFSDFKPFITKYSWEGINCSSKIDDWEKFEKNNLTIALITLYTKEKEILPAYISKRNSTREKLLVLLMIPKEEKEG